VFAGAGGWLLAWRTQHQSIANNVGLNLIFTRLPVIIRTLKPTSFPTPFPTWFTTLILTRLPTLRTGPEQLFCELLEGCERHRSWLWPE
jgi:hypothetical protein